MSIKFKFEPTPINRDLRMKVLEYALKLEKNTNTLLLDILNIPNKEAKSLSGKSGSLSFKNKIDLLLDLEVLEKNDHSQLLLLMEFRNKFLHDLDCDSFETALSLFGGDKNNVIIKLLSGENIKNKAKKKETLEAYNSKTTEEREALCQDAYSQLFDRTVKIMTDKIILFENKYDDQFNTVRSLFKGGSFFYIKHVSFLDKLCKSCEANKSYPDLLRLIKEEEESTFLSEEADMHLNSLRDDSWTTYLASKKLQE